MRKLFTSLALCALVGATAVPSAQAEVGIGADVVSRYVFRGADFGNSASIQPSISYAAGSVEVGAWSSWAITSAAANENDLYVTYSTGDISVTVTDYFFPMARESDFFSYSDGDEIHVLEVLGAYSAGPIDVMGAFNFSGDPDNSFYVEGSYELIADDDISLGVSVGAGNEVYTTDGDPMIVAVGVNVSKGDYMASYILNPEAETSFLVFGRSF